MFHTSLPSQPTHRSSPGPQLRELIQPSSLGTAAFSPQSHKTGPKPSIGSNSSITGWSKDRIFQQLPTASKGAKETSKVPLSPGYPSPTSEVTDLLWTSQKLTGLHGIQKASSARTRAEGLRPEKDRHTEKAISRRGINAVHLMTNMLQIFSLSL